LAEKVGFPHIQFLIGDLFQQCLEKGDYERAEKELLALIDRGYLVDNFMRMAQLRTAQKRWPEVIEAGKKAMEGMRLAPEDLDADCFPFKLGVELNCFKLFMGMAGAFLELRDFGSAARFYHMASKLKTDSHKPFLGFAKTYLAAGQLDRAEVALSKLPQPGGMNDPETHRLLALVCRKRNNLPLAFECLKKAFEKGPDDELNVEPFYFVGAALGRWPDMVEPLRLFLLQKDACASGYARLSAVHLNLGEDFQARESASRAIELDPSNPVARSVLERVESRAKASQRNAQVKEGQDGLTLDLATELSLASMDQAPIVW
jgi:tetratricopeptide (TPR) repeat protein